MLNTDVVIVAAGSGSRSRAEDDEHDLPKQFQAIAGRPLLSWTLAPFLSHPNVREVQLVIGADHHDLFATLIDPHPRLKPATSGGSSRQESVRLGLEALSQDPPDLVLVHDAARPFVDRDLIDRIIDRLASGAAGVVPVIPIADSLRRIDQVGALGLPVDRSTLVAVQTPQGFGFAALLQAHRLLSSRSDLTDDAQVLEHTGAIVASVDGAARNVKITYPEDLERAATLLMDATHPPRFETRAGNGFDVHRFGPGSHVTLCGVELPFGKSLVGHSDADVGLHTLTDAILGALGDGDIGTHFPPSDPRWKGAPSHLFLTFARDQVTARGGYIINVDVTLICEAPKIGPWRDRMIHAVAPLLGISPDRVSIKATTTERLGFAGRGEGIAAMATVNVALPVADMERNDT